MHTNVSQAGKLDSGQSRMNNYHHPGNLLLPKDEQDDPA